MTGDERGATEGPVRSVWHDVQAEQGAEFEDFDGWLWTSTLGDPLAEYRAIRNDVALWDVYPLVKWDFSGPDALRAAQRVFTNDVTSMSAGAVRYGPSSTRAVGWSTTGRCTSWPTTTAGS